MYKFFLFFFCTLLGGMAAHSQVTTSFNFSLASQPVSGWINVTGDPSTGVRTATNSTTGVSISSISIANWIPLSGVGAAFDGVGATGGTFFPSGVLLNHWFQDGGSVAVYNASVPQLQISGLNKDSFYTVQMAGSSTSTLNSNPTVYTVTGLTVYGPINVNNHNNTANGAVFSNVKPDASGTLRIYVNTLTTTDIADICGIQITRGQSGSSGSSSGGSTAGPSWLTIGNGATRPDSNFLGTVDSNRLAIRTNNLERMSILPAGNVGIGTATPRTNLETNGYIAATKGISVGPNVFSGNTPVNGFTLTFESPAVGAFTAGSGTGFSYLFRTNGIERLGISDSAVTIPNWVPNTNLLLGVTTNNGNKLQVNGNIWTTGFILATGAASGKVLTSDGVGNASWQSPAASTGGNWLQSSATAYDSVDNIAIGTSNTQGNKLAVNGNSFFSGNVGIGTATPQSRLAVDGAITAMQVKVSPTGWPDYVFDKKYRLLSLADLNAYLDKYKHLPGVVSEQEVREKGLDLGKNQAVLLKKVEELTLYVIELDKKVEKLTKENALLKKKSHPVNRHKTK